MLFGFSPHLLFGIRAKIKTKMPDTMADMISMSILSILYFSLPKSKIS